MKLVDMLVLSLAVVFIVIAGYETMTVGLARAYWKLMLAIGLFFFYVYRKKK